MSPKYNNVLSLVLSLHRSQLMAQVTCVRQSWLQSVALAGQRRSFIKEQLGEWRVYRRGSKLLWKLLRDVDPLLPPAGPAVCSLQQLQTCADDYQVSMNGYQ